MRGYRMVICTFRQPEANEPVDMQRLTSSSTPFVNQGQTSSLTHRDRRCLLHLSSTRGKRARWHAETNVIFCTFVIHRWWVRWHAGVPYGYLHLLSTRGKRARWHIETNVVFCTYVIQRQRVRWHMEILYGYQHLSSTKANKSDDIGMMLAVRFWLFWKSLQVLLSSSRDIQVQRRARFFSARQGQWSSIACGNVMVISFYRFQGTEVLLTLRMMFHWLGYWSAEWCSARTKLVSYLYFPFITNKR